MVRSLDANQSMTDIDRVQELFPNDDLKLHEVDPAIQKCKQIHRSRSITANRLQRAFSTKNKLLTSPERETDHSTYGRHTSTVHRRSRSAGGAKLVINRKFLMDGPVQLTSGLQSQERHFFLFNDIMLIAKPRSSGNYKLKAKVRVSEMWLSDCIDDVAEVFKSPETSFVMGWPIHNHVASFSTAQAKNLWYEKLNELISEEKKRDSTSSTMIHVSFYHYINEHDTLKLLTVKPSTNARECIERVLQESGQNEEEKNDYQMWVKTSSDDSPYPLIGHEYPYAIKMNRIKDLFVGNYENEELQNNINNNIDSRVSFILRKVNNNDNNNSSSSISGSDTLKKTKKHKKATIINWPPILGKLNTSRQQSADSFDSGLSSNSTQLFGLELSTTMDENCCLPDPIMGMLKQLFIKGPFTVGIFRKSANARLCKEVRAKLDSGIDVDFETVPITVSASLIKEFLRNLPQCVLMTEHYEDWLAVQASASEADQIVQIRKIVSKLPKCNIILLQHFLCVLYHIAQKSSENMMSASNLAICVGPSLLSPSANATYSQPNPTDSTAKQIPILVEFLIINCAAIFGDETLSTFGNPPDRDPARQDSGSEESDSLHSLQERRDDSSIDSLERELLGESSPKLRSSNRNKMSLSNLSRDSGLTLSDTQLYTPDEEIDSEAGGSSNGGDSTLSPGKTSFPIAARSVPHINTSGLDQPDFHQSMPHDNSKKHYQSRRQSSANMEPPTAVYDAPKYTRVYTDNNTQTRLNSSYSTKDPSMELQNAEGIHIKRRVKRATASKIRPISNIETCNDNLKDNMYRCVSEESILGPYDEYTNSISANETVNNNNKRPVTHRKGRAPSPPANELCQPKPPARASRSRHRAKTEFKRSQSTPRLDGGSESSCGKHEVPPSYHEALCRRTILKRLHTPPKVHEVTDQQRLEQMIASKHARQLYEESLKQFSSQDKRSPGAAKQHTSLHRTTSEGLHLKLQHLPPVHLKDESKTKHVGRNKRLSSSQQPKNDNGIISTRGSQNLSVNVKYQVHEYSMYDDRNDIQCSVAKLRQLFGEKSAAKQSSSFSPPPYRPPPPAGRMYHGNSRDCASFLNKPVVILHDLPNAVDENFGEESYV